MTERGPSASPDRAAWPRILPFAVFIVLLLVEPWLAEWLAGVLDERWLYAFRSAVTALVLLLLWGRYVELRQTPPTGVAGWVAGIAVGVGVFVLWIALDFPPLVMGEGDPFDPRVDGRIHAGFALTRLAGAALVVPVMEEIFWRSFLMRWLEKPNFLDVDPGDVGPKALLITSAVFAAEHRLWFAGLLAGLLYGELYRRTRDIRVVVVSHAVTNGLLGVYVLATDSWSFW